MSDASVSRAECEAILGWGTARVCKLARAHLELLLEVEELRRDKDRMDWLDSDSWWDFSRAANPKEPTKTFHIDTAEGENCNSLSAESAREAIDAAMDQK